MKVFGPNGSMIIVDALTDNVNRTASDVRAAFEKGEYGRIRISRLYV